MLCLFPKCKDVPLSEALLYYLRSSFFYVDASDTNVTIYCYDSSLPFEKVSSPFYCFFMAALVFLPLCVPFNVSCEQLINNSRLVQIIHGSLPPLELSRLS
ncbi:hypothetical protein V6N11_031362 [Hibiscus sabdariffa]|uniref:Uncharacterized protein n=1 Tax=Hibiscus sabdariffa TaxID=183260 RepID=A0ABR2SXF2_9ROSI